MSDVSALLKEVTERHHCRMVLAGEKVRLSAPRPLPGQVMERLRRHKRDVIDYLARARILGGVEALLSSTGRWDTDRGMAAVCLFLRKHLNAAHGAGWADEELFACYPDVNFAPVRYDYAGPGTSSALSGVPIDRVTRDQIRFQNNLVHRKRPLQADWAGNRPSAPSAASADKSDGNENKKLANATRRTIPQPAVANGEPADHATVRDKASESGTADDADGADGLLPAQSACNGRLR